MSLHYQSNIVRYAFYQEHEHLIEQPSRILYKAIMEGKKQYGARNVSFNIAQSNSSFALKHCYQKISMGNVPLNESLHLKQEGVNDYLRDKQAGKTEGITIYQILE